MLKPGKSHTNNNLQAFSQELKMTPLASI